MADKTRTEQDSLGELKVPADAAWGAQTQRAIENFAISGEPMPAAFIRALGLIKAAAARVNGSLQLLPADIADAIEQAARRVAAGEHAEQFPVDIFQTGSGTSSNMNANEVIARLAMADSSLDIHPNDHVNLGQSSNDVIPTAIHVSAVIAVEKQLRPALTGLVEQLQRKAEAAAGHIKTGRTHLMDAMPVKLADEINAWAEQLRAGQQRLDSTLPRCLQLAQGGTAVGTGVNAHAEFAARFAAQLAGDTGHPFTVSPNFFVSLASQDTAVELSGQLKVLAVSLMKISNDLRWMNSGPLAGLGEIQLKALQPGSSIMPGKVNPVIPEAVAMACAQVIGNDLTISVAGQSGNFQLNVMLPVIAANLLHSIKLLANSAAALAQRCVADFDIQDGNLRSQVARNPILVTALNRLIGYDAAARIAKTAYREGRAVIDVAEEMTELSRQELEQLLDPGRLS